MQVRSFLLVLVPLALAACYPRQPVAPPPLPPPPPPRPAVSPAEEAVARMQRARRAYDEGVGLGRQSRWAEAADRFQRQMFGGVLRVGLHPVPQRAGRGGGLC